MRLRNVKDKKLIMEQSNYLINDYSSYRGKWNSYFKNDNPIYVEIGMGKGKFLIENAILHPDINYIGIERYTSVLLRAIQKMEENPLPNVRFLCVDAATLPEIFAPEEVDRIYLNFSDPWPKDRHARRRLTSTDFLNRYDLFLSKKGHLEFKTDNKDLFDFSLEEIENSSIWKLEVKTYDLHNDPMLNFGNIMTEYEEKFSSKGNPICKLIASR